MLLDKKFPLSYNLGIIRKDLFIVAIVIFATNVLSWKFHNLIPDLNPSIPAFIGSAISILLSFKIGQSYDRWWEARKIWGSIVNDSRNLILLMNAHIKEGNNKEIKIIAYRHIAWLYSLGQTLRNQNPIDNVSDYLSKADFKDLVNYSIKPLGIMQQNFEHISRLRDTDQIDTYSYVKINDILANFITYQGMCERIKSTVFPAGYRKYLHWAIYVFIVILTITFHDYPLAFELVLIVAIASIFFLLERSSIQLQNPFQNSPSDTPIKTITRKIEINIKELLKENDIPNHIEPHEFYIM